MRLAILSTVQGVSWGGTEEVWVQLARRALLNGHQVIAAVDYRIAASKPVQALLPFGLQLSIRRPLGFSRLNQLKQRFWPAHQSLRRFKPDMLLINAGSVLDPLHLPHLYALCRQLPLPQVLFCHFHSDLLTVPHRQQLRSFLLSMRHVVFVAENNRSDLERSIATSLRDSSVIANQSRAQLPSPLPWPDTSIPQLACVSRFEVIWKGHDLLLEALSSPEIRSVPWYLSFFGAGQDERYVSELIHYYDLQDRVRIVGFEANLERIWASHHLLVLPSRGEGMPLVALEALMHGRPVLATAVGGVCEVVQDGREGYISESATVPSLRRTLHRALSDAERWQELGRVGHRTAQQFSRLDPPETLLTLLEQLQ